MLKPNQENSLIAAITELREK